MLLRVFLNFIVFIGIILFWNKILLFLLLLFGVFIFQKYYEVFIWTIIIDAIFNISNFYFFTLIFIILFIIINYMKEKIFKLK